MGSLNYGNVDFKEFESLAKDVMNRILGKHLERFGEGKDGGIDLVDDTAEPMIIVQCKQYSSSTSAVNELFKERDKIEKFPSLKKYYIFTSTSLLPQQVLKLREYFAKWMDSDDHIIYKEKIEDFFNEKANKDILEKHLNLFVSLPGWYKGDVSGKTLGYEITKTPVLTKLYGRDQELKTLETMILENQHLVLVNGMGGIGKTALARQLYRRMKNEFTCIGWINYRESLKESFNTDILDPKFTNIADYEERAKAIYYFLRGTQSAILFIDNVSNDIWEDETLTELIGCENVTLVLTSRREYIEQFTSFKVGYLNEGDCIELFYSHYRKPRTEADTAIIKELVQWAFCHTLTIELLAKAAIRERSLSDYLERLRENGFKAPKLKVNNRTVLENLQMLYRMAEFEPGSEQYRILWNLAIMPTMDIPMEVEDWICADINDLEELIQSGWLENHNGTYYMHSLIQEIILQETEDKMAPKGIAERLIGYIAEDKFSPITQIYTEKQKRFDILKSILEHIRYEDYDEIDSFFKTYARIANELGISVTVKVNADGYLLPFYEDHGKSKHIFEFMKAFTAADKDEQGKMLVRIRELIVLFYCGEDAYQKACAQATTWSFGMLEWGEQRSFCEQLEKELETYKALENPREKKKKAEELKEKLDHLTAGCYREAVRVICMELDPELALAAPQNQKIDNKFLFAHSDFYWLDYIESEAIKLLTPRVNITQGMFTTRYLCEKTWQIWTSFMAQKFIEYGKAVFHFAMPADIGIVANGATLPLGKVQDQFLDGISIFDYDRIDARESLDRDICNCLMFAINNFSSATVSMEERVKGGPDVLMRSPYSTRKGYIQVYDDLTRRILQYFGGISLWKAMDSAQADVVLDASKEDLFEAVRKQFYQLRKVVFYNTGKAIEKIAIDDIIRNMFCFEKSLLGTIYGKKYCSNNVQHFYSRQSILDLIVFLYSLKGENPSKVPSFKKLMPRERFREYMLRCFNDVREYRDFFAVLEVERQHEFCSSQYYVFKEIYYYGFLRQKGLRTVFEDSLYALKKQLDESKDCKDNYHRQGVRNFECYYRQLDKSLSFGEVCQAFMNESILPNNEDKMVYAEALDKSNSDKEVYVHFRVILYEVIRNAFIKYLREQKKLAFLMKPVYEENNFFNMPEETFCEEWNIGFFKDLDDVMDQDPVFYCWYTVAHFLHPRQLNFLIGRIKNYIQFEGDINRRAASLENRYLSSEELEERLSYYKNLIVVLEFVQNFSGKISNNVGDYFEGSDDKEQKGAYAKFLAHFVDFVDFTGAEGADVYIKALVDFCTKEVTGKRDVSIVGIYCNQKKVILNKNVIFASLYANPTVLANSMRRVTMSEIQEYYRIQEQLAPLFRSVREIREEQTKAMNEQMMIRIYQNLKNRIELYDIIQYMEVINEMMGQLVSWAYLRDRDMMYFRLGYYYTKLFFTSSIGEDDTLRKLDRDGIHVPNGAVLYQIVAVYTYALHVIKVNCQTGELSMKDSEGMAYVGSEHIFTQKYAHDNGETFNAGMELIERTGEADSIRSLRNDIVHFSYFVKTNRSLLSMYNDMYDIFFTYNSKIRNYVTHSLINTMARHHMNINLAMEQDTRDVTYMNYGDNDEKTKQRKRAKIVVSEHGIESKDFIFRINIKEPKFKGSKEMIYSTMELPLPVHEKVFLEQMQSILEYCRVDM